MNYPSLAATVQVMEASSRPNGYLMPCFPIQQRRILFYNRDFQITRLTRKKKIWRRTFLDPIILLIYHVEEKQQSLSRRSEKWGKAHCQHSSLRGIIHLGGRHDQWFLSLSGIPSLFSHQQNILTSSSQQFLHHFSEFPCIPLHSLLCQPNFLHNRVQFSRQEPNN